MEALGRVLIIAGSDSGGGAGIQADLKTCTALGGYGMTAITAVTVQNTLGVSDVHLIPPAIVTKQAEAVLSDLGIDVIKTGMLGTGEILTAVADFLDGPAKAIPAVIDPVMVAKGGASLLSEEAISLVKSRLVPRATLLTPNAPEAEALTGIEVRDVDGQKQAGEALLAMGAKAVLVKGGHLEGETVLDLLVTSKGLRAYESPRQDTTSTHGTGCTLASAIATALAQGESLEQAIALASAYVEEAIRHAPGFGKGHGPLDHAWMSRDGEDED